MRVRNSVMVLLGVLVAVLPYLGFPGWMKRLFFVALGLVIATISYFAGVAHRGDDMMSQINSSAKGARESHGALSESEQRSSRA